MSIVGTEGFIPPEGPGSPQADIYSLGKVLYEASTGMDRSHFPELPTQVGEFEDGPLFRELNAVIAKACRKHAEERYASAETMQADLLMISEGRSVRRSQILEQQIARLKQAAVVLVLLSVLIGGAWIYQSEQTAKMAELAQTNETLANQKADLAETTTELAQQMRRQVLGLQMQKGIGYMEEEDYLMALLWLTKALENVEPGSVEDRIHRIRIQHLMRRLPRLEHIFVGQNDKNGSTALSPDGKTIVTSGSMGGVIEFWDVATGQRIGAPLKSKDEWIKTITFQEGGTKLLSTGDRWVELWDVATRTLIVSFEDNNVPYFFSFSSHFAIARRDNGRTYIEAWNMETGTKTIDSKYISTPYSNRHRTHGLTNLRSSEDGRILLFVAFGCPLYFIDPSNGEEIRPPLHLEDRVIMQAFFHKNPDQIVALTKEIPHGDPLEKGTTHISLINWHSGTLVKDLHTFDVPVESAKLYYYESGERALYERDGKLAYVVLDENTPLVVKKSVDYKPENIFLSHDGSGFYPKIHGKEIRLESISNGRFHSTFTLPRAIWLSEQVGNIFLTDNYDQCAKIWSLPQQATNKHVYKDMRRRLDVDVMYHNNGTKFFISGSRLASGYELGINPTLELEWYNSKKEQVNPMSLMGAPDRASFVLSEGYSVPRSGFLTQSDILSHFHYIPSQSGFQLTTQDYSGFMEFFRFTESPDHFTGLIHEIKDPKDRSDGLFGKAHVMHWNTSDGQIHVKEKIQLPEQGQRQGYEMSPLGSYVAVPNMEILTLIDARSGETLWKSKFETMIITTAFSHDETKLALSASEEFIVVDTSNGAPIGKPFVNHNFPVNFTFSPTGDSLAYATLSNETIHVFQFTPEPKLIAEIETIDLGANRSMLFSPDGTMLLALFDKGAQLYSAKTGWPIMPLLHSGESLHPDDELNVWNRAALDADFHPEGTEFTVAFGEYATTSFDLTPTAWPVEDLQNYAQAMVGLDIDLDDKERPIYGMEVKKRFQKVKDRHPEFWEKTTRQQIDWHLSKASQCEENQMPDGVNLHLERIASFDPELNQDWLPIVEAQLALGKYKEAETTLRALSASEIEQPRASAMLAITLTLLGKTSEARNTMESLTKVQPVTDNPDLIKDLLFLSLLHPEAAAFKQSLMEANHAVGPSAQLAEYLAWLLALEENPEQAQSILQPFLSLNARRGSVARKGMLLALSLAAYQKGNTPLAREYAYIYGSPEFPSLLTPSVDWREPIALECMERHINTLLGIDLNTYGKDTPPPLHYPSRDPKCGPNQLDLSEHFNFSLIENVSRGRRSADLCSLSELPTGLVRLQGVEFDIRGGIQLNGRSFDENRRMQKNIQESGTVTYPEEVLGIRINRQAQRLHFLHAGQGMFDQQAGKYVIHFQDGTTEEIPLIVGENTDDWWRSLSNDHPNHTPQNAWEGHTPAAGYQGFGIRLINMSWENPHPEKMITTMDFTSSDYDAAPFLIAVTAEQ